MAKKYCVICAKELGMLADKVAISDGVVCADCLKAAGIGILPSASSYNTAGLTELLTSRAPLAESFSPTKKIGSYLKVDENNKTFKIGPDLFEYANLLSFELLEDGQSIAKGGLGRAVAGGLLFGGVGAIVGGVTGGKKTKGICNSMKLRVTLKNALMDTAYIVFIKGETKTKSNTYKLAQESAQSCISALEIIADQNKSEAASEPIVVQNAASAADELVKFKQLLDAGVITQEEFDAQKKQLLGL